MDVCMYVCMHACMYNLLFSHIVSTLSVTYGQGTLIIQVSQQVSSLGIQDSVIASIHAA